MTQHDTDSFSWKALQVYLEPYQTSLIKHFEEAGTGGVLWNMFS